MSTFNLSILELRDSKTANLASPYARTLAKHGFPALESGCILYPECTWRHEIYNPALGTNHPGEGTVASGRDGKDKT